MNKNKLIIIFIIIFFTTTNIFADTETENAELAKIVQVLDSLNPLINTAEKQQDPNTRIQFCYDCLRNDIVKVKSGIASKFENIDPEPRTIKPLTGDYLIFAGKKDDKKEGKN